MFIEYNDIRSRIAEPPKWWLNGVPRYCSFAPDECGIYGEEALLVKAACQACGKVYDLGVSGSGGIDTFKDDIELFADLSIGDPPNACCTGTSMLAVPIKVLEFWERTLGQDWSRLKRYEGWLKEAFYADARWADAANADGGISSIFEFYSRANRSEEYWAAWNARGWDTFRSLCSQAGSSRSDELVFNRKARQESIAWSFVLPGLSQYERRAILMLCKFRMLLLRTWRKTGGRLT